MLGSIKILDHPFVRSIADKLARQERFHEWIGTVPRDEAVCGIVVGAMLEFFLARPNDGRDFVAYTDAVMLDGLAGVPGFSRAMWLSGVFSKVEVPREGVAVEQFNAWFGPDANRLITAMLYVYAGDQPAADPTGPPIPKPKERAVGFEEFWLAYPRKKGKGPAREKYDGAVKKGITHARIMAALEKAKASKDWVKDDGKFIPHPSTWLHQERYDDEPDVKLTDASAPTIEQKRDQQRRKISAENERRERIKRGEEPG